MAYIDSFSQGGNTYFRVYISCPVCLDLGKNTPQSYWVHADSNCGGDLYMGENAYYLCKKCGISKHVMNWSYGCPNHSSGDTYEYIKATRQGLAQAVSTAGQMVSATGIAWLTSFLQNMEKEC